MNIIRKYMKIIMKILVVLLKPFKKILNMMKKILKKIYNYRMTPMIIICIAVISIMVYVIYRKRTENFAIYQQEATLNPINNKQKKF